MDINLDKNRLQNSTALDFVNLLEENKKELYLDRAQLYYDFPILKDANDNVAIAQILLITPMHGVIVINTTETISYGENIAELQKIDQNLENMFSLIFSRLIRNKSLRKSKTELAMPTNTLIFAPLLDEIPPTLTLDSKIIIHPHQLESFFQDIKVESIDDSTFEELLSTIEGAKGIIRPKERDIANLNSASKGILANKIETEITRFDIRQKHGAMSVLDGFQRIRGLAGSGKTVVLAMKAALTHLRDPNAVIVYTFYTKSLYQHIQRLITRFYRQFDDKDPDWSRIKIMHGWGGYRAEGVYFNACQAHSVSPVSFSEATNSSKDPFDYACTNLLDNTNILPIFDYIFIDEGQDFPPSFIKLCIKLSKNERVVFAYDDLQTIFQPTAPAIKDIVGTDQSGNPTVDLIEDVILYKCYRNPREILVCAHALGLGIYGSIVQMLENKEQWEDIGYKVITGDFVEGSPTKIERPEKNSLVTISENQDIREIVKVFVCENFDDEIAKVVQGIKSDIDDGLRPEDILVITVDDRHAKSYLDNVVNELKCIGIDSNNIHGDSYNVKYFQKDGKVTLSTVHKAKGNEAFMVYVMGVDALYSSYAGPRERNVLFTAMTRAKGWVRISGIGQSASDCAAELNKAIDEFPYLCFNYPSQVKIIARDLAAKANKKLKAERKLDEVLSMMSPEEIKRFLEQRSIKKGK